MKSNKKVLVPIDGKPPVQLDLELCETSPCYRFMPRGSKELKCSNCPWITKQKELLHVICTNCPSEVVCVDAPEKGKYCQWCKDLAEDIDVFFLRGK
jgi:hypothetical protein